MYNLFVAISRETGVHYGERRQTIRNVQEQKKIKWKNYTPRTWKSHQGITMYIVIYQDIPDMGQVMPTA